MQNKTHTLFLTEAQFDALEEATDIMALGNHFVDSLEGAIEYLSKKYITEVGPEFECDWGEDSEIH